jgi:RNA-directed DNA polymerase
VPEPYSKISLDIRTLDHLGMRLHIPLDELQEVAAKAEFLYSFKLEPKKNGGYREISKPKFRLKRIQRAIHRLLQEIKVSDCAHCGIKGRSNLTNSKIHSAKKWLFSLDFKQFYPSISNHRLYHLFLHELNCTKKVASLLTRLCTVRGQVPQGGSMSTDIANLVCCGLDARLKGLATTFGLDYSRFNDDLFFSGDAIPEKFVRKVKDIIFKTKLSMNPEKEHLRGQNQPQIVTGLTVNRRRPKVPRETRRQWRAEKHFFETYESQALPEELRRKRQQQIQGRTSYLNYIGQT